LFTSARNVNKKKTTVTLAIVLLFNMFMLVCVKDSLSTQLETTLANQVWVDDDSNESTPGWGVTHFQTIQDGINGVTDGGIVHAASGNYYENVVVNRTVFLVGEDKSRTIIDGNYTLDSLLSIIANNVSIEGFMIQNCIYLGREKGGLDINSWYNNISNVCFTQNWIDLTVFGRYNRISSCIMNASFWNIKILANNNSILENRFNNSYSALSLTAAHGNSIENNTITDEYIGISLYESTQNEIAANFAFNCSQKNLALESHSTNNIVTLNTFSSSYQGAIEDANSGNNTFYHNSFINNTLQVSLAGGQNRWDSGYPAGGNYWSDYNGTDLYSGPHQNQRGSDGIGDTPYNCSENNQDRYPLMQVFANIAVHGVEPIKTVVGQGYGANIEILVENQGWETKTTDFAAYLNTTAILTFNGLVMGGRNQTILIYTWQTSGYSKENYTIRASATASSWRNGRHRQQLYMDSSCRSPRRRFQFCARSL